ncbi:P-loop containing nucleoside triphosphate hydrolase protein [Thozetella sp. PMI_491]|nr:P-loop containing nucleoside triphosphate hydrolase protein [Thozetella sp. PMI_491]
MKQQEELDVERHAHDTSYLFNTVARNLSWSDINVTVRDRATREPKQILNNISGHVTAAHIFREGELLAIMGPSGCGKTTLLNVLAHRECSGKTQASGAVLVNNQRPPQRAFRQLSSYVECDDALVGALTVKETLYFGARLSLSASCTAAERTRRVNELIQAFGLTAQANTIIGTLVRKGISTGQRRRVSVAAQLISAPKILFLDEPTSGLDSEASFSVMSFVRDVAKANNLMVVASMHQPSTTTFELFDKLLLLSGGKMCFFGETRQVKPYFDGIGFPMPSLTNPADFMLRLTNIDFERDTEAARARIEAIYEAWKSSPIAASKASSVTEVSSLPEVASFASNGDSVSSSSSSKILGTTWTLLHRSWIKSYRDFLVYGLRFGMYLGLAILMGTVWLRLPPTQSSLQPYANCILFGSAFMSFMAVVYVPAFVEDRAVFVKDRANGLYGSAAFAMANFFIGLPYLFAIALTSSAFVYWMVNFRPDAAGFFVWVLWMYLNLVAAESLVVLMSALFPNFVGALALTAMANGVWMAANGFMVPVSTLNVFYKYVFYYINYQAYVFRGLLVNEFGFRNYSCGDRCFCQYDTPLRDQCLIAGPGVLEAYGFEVTSNPEAKRVVIILGIIAVMRLLGWAALHWRK